MRDLKLVDGDALSGEMQRLLYLILDSIHISNDDYIFLTGDKHIHDSGVENYVAASIARRLVMARPTVQQHRLAFSSLEVPYGAIIQSDSGSAQRVDVLLYDEAKRPVVAIELKRHLEDLRGDYSKLKQLVDAAHVHYGVLAAFGTRTAQSTKTSEGRLKSLIERMEGGRALPGGYVERDSLTPESNIETFVSFAVLLTRTD